MFPKPVPLLHRNTLEYETLPMVKPTGFREYDARWLFGEEINLMGIQALGLGLAATLGKLGVAPEIVVAHDFRSYSASIKNSLVSGLMAGGCNVHDIGLAVTPMAYFAQFELDVAAVAMVTASHNENGWTGVKMGAQRPLTFGPDEMGLLRDVVLSGKFIAGQGSYRFVEGIADRYSADLIDRQSLERPLKVVVACGNGTAGAFAPGVLEAVGVQVIQLDCDLDHTFPRYNPNPEDLVMLEALSEAVLLHSADLGLAFDGDGDRCGVVDNEGTEIFADKMGVLLARDLCRHYSEPLFVADVKSTGLFRDDPVLQKAGARTDYWKTGHSYIKRRVAELGALVGFEKSGHYFFNAPIGRGYDDALISALAICDLLDGNPDRSLADLRRSLPQTWGSPSMSPHCADEIKYQVVERVLDRFQGMQRDGEMVAGQPITDLVTVNGVRVVTDDGTWGLVRASSNKPELVVVIESPVSEQRMRDMFAAIDAVLRTNPEVGQYNQTI